MNVTIPQWPADTFVLIPSYKSAVTLKTLLPRIQTLVPARNICVVDDGSLDGTNLLCRDFGVHCIAHYSNQGKGASLADGFRFLLKNLDARWIVTMDADGQHAIEDVPRFIDSVRRDASAGLCIGKREKAVYKMPVSRILSNGLTSLILSILVGQRMLDCQCGFRIYSKQLLERVVCKYTRFEMESEIILRAAYYRFPIKFVKVQTLYFNENSHISHVKDTIRWLRAVTDVWLELHKNKRISRNPDFKSHKKILSKRMDDGDLAT
jgi:UDP-N-acetylglucosamine---dolichyl-phosphate N-acetylglucosaminyltransferase